MLAIAPTALIAIAAATALCAWTAHQELSIPSQTAFLGVFVASCGLAALFLRTGLPLANAVAFATLVVTCALIAEIDRRSQIIPDLLTLALTLLVTTPLNPGIASAIAGALLLGGIFFLVRLAFEWRGALDALGLGDLKLATVVGALLGPQFGLIAVAVAGAATLAAAAFMALKRERPLGIPFGVGLGATLVFVVGFVQWNG